MRGEGAWSKGKELIPQICNNPVLIGRSIETSSIRGFITQELSNLGIKVNNMELTYGCCEVDLKNLQAYIKDLNCDGVIAAGGGKVLDSGKLLSHRMGIPSITIPLSASTCAGWTALSNIYSKEGSFKEDQTLGSCPEVLIFDHGFIKSAPSRTIASGIADALAKWYEASLSSGSSEDALIQQALQMARVLRDQLFIDGIAAFKDSNSDEWVRVIECCGLTAGLIGGIGGAKCRAAVAHSLHNGLTQIHACNKNFHGEIVGFGIIVQLRLEEILWNSQLAKQSRMQLIPFLKELGLPVSLKDLGLSLVSINDLKKACKFACKEGSDILNLPFKVKESELLEALISAEHLTSEVNYKNNEKVRQK